jgi:cytochrome c oxidase subunit II
MKKHLIIVSIIAAVLSVVLAYFSLNTDLIPFPYSAERESIDNLLKILFGIASVFFAIIITVFVYALLFFRSRPGDNGEGRPIKGNSTLERMWTLIPLIIVLVLAAYGGIVLNDMTKAGPPGSELEIDVTAARYSWQFDYPAYKVTSFELHVPVNQRIHILLQAKDVVHSFWVQEWGPKQDAVPGLTTEVRYTPNKIGQYQVQCSQLCGYGHTFMTAPAFVTSSNDFQTWIQQQQQKAPPTPIATPTPSGTATSPISPSSTPTPEGAGAATDLIAQNIAFDKSSITVKAGSQIIINFNNIDNVPHNFSVYTDSSAATPIFKGNIIGLGTITYTFTAPGSPGTYFFRCDVHPTMMTGTFIVQ